MRSRLRPLDAPPPLAPDVATNSPTPLVVLPVEKLGENAITAKLAKWDRDLNPSEPGAAPPSVGLPSRASSVPVDAVPAITNQVSRPKGILLIVHGTFSLGRAILRPTQ